MTTVLTWTWTSNRSVFMTVSHLAVCYFIWSALHCEYYLTVVKGLLKYGGMLCVTLYIIVLTVNWVFTVFALYLGPPNINNYVICLWPLHWPYSNDPLLSIYYSWPVHYFLLQYVFVHSPSNNPTRTWSHNPGLSAHHASVSGHGPGHPREIHRTRAQIRIQTTRKNTLYNSCSSWTFQQCHSNVLKHWTANILTSGKPFSCNFRF